MLLASIILCVQAKIRGYEIRVTIIVDVPGGNAVPPPDVLGSNRSVL